MKTLALSLLSALLLCACATPQRAFENDSSQFGLYVAATNIFTESEFTVQQEGGKVFYLKVRHLAAGDSTGYIMASLPPGRYHLMQYNPDGRTLYTIATPNGWFEVQASCYNYGGKYDFELGADGLPTYTNSTTLQDIAALPHHYRDLAQGRDICSATMGHASERLAAADVAQVLSFD